ncbi:MAG: T9SS type A sorting domain-containing protein [Saprospiraceae bacterium]
MRILTTTLVFCLLVCAKGAFAQPICSGNFTATNQTQINGLLSTCTVITGDLLIIDDGDLIDPITSLAPLSGLTSIGRDFHLVNTSVSDLSPLNALTNITRDIYINNNDDLINLNGLGNLGMSSARTLQVQGNALLEDIDALASSNITSFISNVSILDNPALTNLNGLANIEAIGNNFSANNNDALTDLTMPLLQYTGGSFNLQQNAILSGFDFASLAVVGNNLNISNNDGLINLDGFPVLVIVGNNLIIQQNDVLVDISSLAFLAAITGSLTIHNNNALPSLDGLQNIGLISGNLTITNNDVLSDCEAICTTINMMSVAGTTTIEGNSGLCANVIVVDFVCLVLPIELTGFSATATKDHILLNWETATELNNAGFEVQRSSNDGRDFSAIAWIEGAGTTQESKTYIYKDFDVKPGVRYTYRLMQLDFDGASTASPVVTATLTGDKFIAGAQYPNPVSTGSILSVPVYLPAETVLQVEVIDALGKIISRKQQEFAAGNQLLEINTDNLSPGFFGVRISSGGAMLACQNFVVVE